MFGDNVGLQSHGLRPTAGVEFRRARRRRGRKPASHPQICRASEHALEIRGGGLGRAQSGYGTAKLAWLAR